jgi:hypothetical protein
MAPSLATHPWANAYFARRTPWSWHDDARIKLADGTVLDAWATAVFHAAEGHTTVGDWFTWLLGEYDDPRSIPADLDTTIAGVLEDLERRGAIAVTDDKRPVEERFDLPLAEQEL